MNAMLQAVEVEGGVMAVDVELEEVVEVEVKLEEVVHQVSNYHDSCHRRCYACGWRGRNFYTPSCNTT